MFPFFNNYPGTDLHEIDLAYILKLCAELRASNTTLAKWKAQHEREYEELRNDVDGLINNLVDIISPWDSSIAYHIFSIVEYQGTNYIAIQDVPVGAMITNTEYWQPANTALEQINAIGVIVSEMQKKKFIFNVRDYGIEPNTGDVYERLFDFFKDEVEPRGGGIVYFPAGTYELSYTLFIPSNTMILGDGPATNIYFNEYDRHFGVGLNAAGDNITFKNFGVSHYTTGVLPSGSAPGALSFSNVDAAQITEKYQHTIPRRTANKNFVAEDLWLLSGNYMIQSEPSADGTLENIVYNRIHCPSGCISLSPYGTIENVSITDCDCDLLHVGVSTKGGKGIYLRNIICTGAQLYNDLEADHIIVNSSPARNHSMTTIACAIDGNVQLKNSIIDCANEAGVIAISVYNGVRVFDHVTVQNTERAFQRRGAISDTDNYELITHCKFEQTGSAGSAIIGYGEQNDFGTGIVNLVYGADYERTGMPDSMGNAQVSSSYPNVYKIKGGSLTVSILYGLNSNNIAKLPACVGSGYRIPAKYFIGTDLAGGLESMAEINTDGVITVSSFLPLSGANRVMINATLPIRRPTPTELYHIG